MTIHYETTVAPEAGAIQMLHDARFDGGTSDGQTVENLLDQIAEGFRAEDATNIDKLNIARKYGPHLLSLKKAVPHGTFLDKLKERFPTVSYSKCNRWMFIAEHENEVRAAIEHYPDVAWGPKKMFDFLKGAWSPEAACSDDEDDLHGESDSGLAADATSAGSNESGEELLAAVGEIGTGETPDSEDEPDEDAKQDGDVESRHGEEKFEKLMNRIRPSNVAPTAAAKKTVPPEVYKLTVVTPVKADLEKFGSVLPNAAINFNAHSVSAQVAFQDIDSTMTAVGKTLAAEKPKKVRIVVER